MNKTRIFLSAMRFQCKRTLNTPDTASIISFYLNTCIDQFRLFVLRYISQTTDSSHSIDFIRLYHKTSEEYILKFDVYRFPFNLSSAFVIFFFIIFTALFSNVIFHFFSRFLSPRFLLPFLPI